MGGDKSAILVAGGAGFIGSHTAKSLKLAGYLPVVLDDLVTGNRWAAGFGPFIEGSVDDRALLGTICREFEIEAAILFAAHAYVGESTRLPGKYYRNNVCASIGFLDGLLSAGVKKLVFSSSCSIYGNQSVPLIGEDAPKNPLSPYAETKLILENVLRWYDSAYGLRSVCLRYFNAAGADAEGDIGEWHEPETHLIPLAIRAALGGPRLRVFGDDYPTPDGTAVRDYVHVSDLADAHIRALRYLIEGGSAAQFNCGSGTGHSVKQVIEMVKIVSGKGVPFELSPRREGDAPSLVADATRVREVLNWVPRHSSLRTVCDTAWQWYSKYRHVRAV